MFCEGRSKRNQVTIRGQTTIPAPVREALKLKPGQD
ncbi:hypothetical protein ACUOA5_05910, partial [Escherichia coli]